MTGFVFQTWDLLGRVLRSTSAGRAALERVARALWQGTGASS